VSKFGSRQSKTDDGVPVQDEFIENPMADDDNAADAPIDADIGEQSLMSVTELQAALDAANSQADDNHQALLLAHAEQENLRKRTARDIEKARKFALEGFAKELLPVKDSLELGLAAAVEVDGGHEQVIEGMELTLNLLTAALEKNHVQEINPVGQPFDPERHQAMATQPSDQHEPNTVITVYQKGYLLHDRLIRPAMVVVAKA